MSLNILASKYCKLTLTRELGQHGLVCFLAAYPKLHLTSHG